MSQAKPEMKPDDRPDVEEIENRAAAFEPALGTRQAQALLAYLEGYSREEMRDLFDGSWGVHGSVYPSHIDQSLDPALEKYEAIKRFNADRLTGGEPDAIDAYEYVCATCWAGFNNRFRYSKQSAMCADPDQEYTCEGEPAPDAEGTEAELRAAGLLPGSKESSQ